MPLGQGILSVSNWKDPRSRCTLAFTGGDAPYGIGEPPASSNPEINAMQNQNNKKKLLIVEQSAPMLHVLRDFCKKKLIDADCHTDPGQAEAALSNRFATFGADYAGVVLGWPEKNSAALEDLLQTLSAADHSNLPVVVLCQQVSGEVRAIVKRRPATRALLWRNYQQLQRLLAASGDASTESHVPQDPSLAAGECRMLFIDNEPSVCIALSNAAGKAGHSVEVARDSDSALSLLDDQYHPDLIAVDQSFCVESPELNARLRSMAESSQIVLLADQLTNSVSMQALELRAAVCFDKNESPVVLCQRLASLVALKIQDPVDVPDSQDLLAVDQTLPVQQLIAALDQPLLVVDPTDGIIVASRGAQSLLGAVADKAFADVAGQPLNQLQQVSAEHMTLALTPIQGDPLTVSWRADSVDIDGMEELQLFGFVEHPPEPEQQPEQQPEPTIAEPEPVANVPAVRRGAILGSHELNDAIDEQLKLTAGCQCLLLLNIEIVATSGDRMDLGSSEPMLKIVRGALANVYKGERSLAYLGNGQFAFLLSTARLQDALILSRKLLQIVPQMVRYADSLKLVSHGALLRYDDTLVNQRAEQVLQQCVAGCETSRERGDDLIYVIHMNQWVRAKEKASGRAKAPLETPA